MNSLTSFFRYLGLFVFSALCQLTFAQSNHQMLKAFSFEGSEKKVLQGLSTDIGDKWGCSKGILEGDIIGDLAIASELYQNGCYTDGRYNHSYFLAEKGHIKNNAGEVLFHAVKLNKPDRLATQFLGSEHKVHMRFQSKVDHIIYSMNNGVIAKVADVPASAITPNTFVKLDISASNLESSIILFAAPKTERVSIYHSLSSGIEGAKVISNNLTDVYKTRYSVDGDIYDTPTGYDEGPASHANKYGDSRHFFSRFTKPHLEVMWQDQTNKKISLTTLTPGKPDQSTVSMPIEKGLLAGAVANGDIWYYVMLSTEGAKEGWLMSATSKGKLVNSQKLNLSKEGLNIHEFTDVESASMCYNQGVLGMIISRKMNRSADGLNHQGAIAVTFDAKSLKVIDNLGQTSGHSFDNFLYPSDEGGFYGMDLGDNYPRGINLHKINDTKRSRLVYAFKTAHGQQSTSPAGRSYPKYNGISSSSQSFYQWSNDNSTYSELGSMIAWDDSYDIYFIGEPDINGKAINNARAIGNLTDPRDIGFIKIKKDFIGQSEYILSEGASEKAGFYTFGGSWSDQSNQGVNWLVDYTNKDTENASRLKAIRVGDEVVLFWEKWTDSSYVSTFMMKADKNGKPTSQAVEIGSHLRINKSDDPIVANDRVIFIQGSKSDGRLELMEVELK